MPVRAMNPLILGNKNLGNSQRIPQTGMITRIKTLDEIKAPSRADQFRKKTFEIKQHQIIETESDESEQDPVSPGLQNKR